MRKVTLFTSFISLLMVYTLNFQPSVVRADWDPSYPYTKWVQMPDVINGLDVNATYLVNTAAPVPPGPTPIYPWQKILADDFPCYQPGPITDIHIWGSWLNDQVYPETAFKLSIHADVPAGVDAPYSHPGEELWSRVMFPTAYRPWATANEYFYEPNTDRIIGTDTTVWQYNFNINPLDAFHQKGTTAVPQIYWLDVQAIIHQPVPPTPELPQYVFGWKTTPQPWQDDAVYGDTEVPGGAPYPQFPNPDGTALLPWKDMHYPPGTIYYPNSLNLAFAITTIPEPGTIVMLLSACIIGLVVYLRRR